MTCEPDRDPADPPAGLFADARARAPRIQRASLAAPISLVLHALALAVVVPLTTGSVSPPAPVRDHAGVLFYPPPPPPLPLPKGRDEDRPARGVMVVAPDPRPMAAFTAPVETPPVEPSPPAPEDLAQSGGGSPTGSDHGSSLGMEGGRDDGAVGGVPEGQPGGVVGGSGDGPVPVRNFDRAPRRLKSVQPQYPERAFVDKVQGTVLVEILIDATGRVVRAEVIRSVPGLDQAARAAVLQWVFAPAVKDGQPVASLAVAPVSFHLY